MTPPLLTRGPHPPRTSSLSSAPTGLSPASVPPPPRKCSRPPPTQARRQQPRHHPQQDRCRLWPQPPLRAPRHRDPQQGRLPLIRELRLPRFPHARPGRLRGREQSLLHDLEHRWLLQRAGHRLRRRILPRYSLRCHHSLSETAYLEVSFRARFSPWSVNFFNSTSSRD